MWDLFEMQIIINFEFGIKSHNANIKTTFAQNAFQVFNLSTQVYLGVMTLLYFHWILRKGNETDINIWNSGMLTNDGEQAETELGQA